MSASKTSAGYFSVLPQELCLYILSFLEWRDLSSMSLLNRQWQSLSRDNMLWKALCAKHWKEMWNSSSRGGLSSSSTNLSSLSALSSTSSSSPAAAELEDDVLEETAEEEDGDQDTSEPVKKKPKVDVSAPDAAAPPAWQDVFKSRLLVDRNWRMGNCAARTLAPQSEVESAAFCLHFDDERFVTATDTIEVLPHPFTTLTQCREETDFSRCQVFNVNTGELIRTMRGHTDSVMCLDFNKKWIVSGSKGLLWANRRPFLALRNSCSLV